MDTQETQRAERIAVQSITVMKAYTVLNDTPFEAHWYPININQVRELKDEIFTRLEMLNLSKKAEDAAKVVFEQLIWSWFNEAQSNSITSSQGCLAPIVFAEPLTSDHPEPSNRWGWKSEAEFLDAHKLTDEEGNEI